MPDLEGQTTKLITVQVTQLNLNDCEAAQQLLCLAVGEFAMDITITSDPYRILADNGNWVTDRSNMAALWTTGKFPIQEVVSTPNEGFAIVQVN